MDRTSRRGLTLVRDRSSSAPAARRAEINAYHQQTQHLARAGKGLAKGRG